MAPQAHTLFIKVNNVWTAIYTHSNRQEVIQTRRVYYMGHSFKVVRIVSHDLTMTKEQVKALGPSVK